MIIVNTNIRRAANTTLMKSLDTFAKDAPWRATSMIVPSDSMSKIFEWLGELAGVKEFTDVRHIESVKKHTHTVNAKKWENTIGIDVDDLKDNGKAIMPRVRNMAFTLAKHPTNRFFSKLVSAISDLCYDGQAFFDTAHPIDVTGGTQSNLLTGAGMSVAHIKTDWGKVRKGFLALIDRAGDPIFSDEGTYVIWAGLDNIAFFDEVFLTDTLSGGGKNPYFKKAIPRYTSYLTGNDWYCIRTDLPVKPFMLLEVEGYKLEWDTTDKFMRDKVYYGAKGRYDINNAYWQLAMMVNN